MLQEEEEAGDTIGAGIRELPVSKRICRLHPSIPASSPALAVRAFSVVRPSLLEASLTPYQVQAVGQTSGRHVEKGRVTSQHQRLSFAVCRSVAILATHAA